MANTASRIYPSGLLSVNGNLDEVTYNSTAPAIKNLFRNTEDFTLWSQFNTTTSPNTILAPNNFKTADLVTEVANSLTKEVSRAITGLTIGATYTVSVYAKANGRTNFRIAQTTETFGTTATNATFNLATGTVAGATGGYISSSIVNIGNGWYRCIASFIPTLATSTTTYLTLLDASNQSPYVGDGTSGMYFWGAQLELGSVATEYQGIGTTDGSLLPATFAKKDNAVGLYVKGNFDEVTYNSAAGANGVVNMSTNSNSFGAPWTRQATTIISSTVLAPDGTMSATRLSIDSTSLAYIGRLYPKSLFTNEQPYTLSLYARLASGTAPTSGDIMMVVYNDNFNSVKTPINAITSEWKRFQVTVTPSLYTNDNLALYIGWGTNQLCQIDLWGVQIERGTTVTDFQAIGAANTIVTTTFANRITANGTNYIKGNFDEVNKPHVVQNLLLYLDPSISGVTANTIRDTVDTTRVFTLDVPELCYTSNPNYITFDRSTSPKYGGGLTHNTTGALTVPNFIYGNHTWEIWIKINDINPLFAYNPLETLEQTNALAVYNGYHCGFMHTSGTIIYDIWDGTSFERTPVSWTLGTTTGQILQGNWYQLVVTRNGNTFAGYINGVAAGTVNNSFTYATNTFVSNAINIGKAYPASPGQSSYVYYTKSSFGGMRMYNRALSPAEVLQNFNANRSKFGI